MRKSLLELVFDFTVINKAIVFKKGSLGLLSVPISFGIVDLAKSLFSDVEIRNIAIPLISICVLFLLYFLFWIFDFVLGVAASKHENLGKKNWFKSSLAYSSIGKIGGVLLINFIAIFITVFLVLLKFNVLSNTVLIIFVWIDLMACFFEIYSIGENIESKSGNKPGIFKLFEKISNIIEQKIIMKIEKLFT